ncbi:hypothetical protein GCM10009116_16320 [Brevundimonas basaltis]|uniref:Uncharacterized protein n=1 Tax=Brevundimonas basaltis TaxID=472166 RepID=A0A7W8MFD3_9CAUL|nr:hypothetical protein [Brevundimonas basaltis]MBB5291058.1 hypothetical protein [Brevundimonas basaltis]
MSLPSGFVVAAALVMSAGAEGGWATVFHSDEAGYYGIQTGGVYPQGQKKTFPIVHATNVVQNNVLYSQGWATVDCQARTIQIWQLSHIDPEFRVIGGGTIPMADRVTEDIEPGTVGDSYYRVVCQGETPMEDLDEPHVTNLVFRFRRILERNLAGSGQRD